jgi:hypothetical protein
VVEFPPKIDKVPLAAAPVTSKVIEAVEVALNIAVIEKAWSLTFE